MQTKWPLDDPKRQAWVDRINEDAFQLVLALEPLDTEPAAEYLRSNRAVATGSLTAKR